MQKKSRKPLLEGILIVLLLLILLMVGLMLRSVIVQTRENKAAAAAAADSAGASEQSVEESVSEAPAFQAVPEQAVISAEDSAETTGVLNENDTENDTLGSTGTSNTESGTIAEGDVKSTDGYGIYSYLQATKSYQDQEYWSGSWCNISEPGSWKTFSDFGCGICCLSNIYSTITGDVCTPDKMYQWAKDDSDYAGDGAISWEELKAVADQIGIGGTLCKEGSYSDFQKEMADSRVLLVLVSSYYDDAIWHNVEGHYVTIWNYNQSTDTVFLTDSSFKANNRTRVALKDIYNALYQGDKYQYLKIEK